ncbi:hypothetical protein AN220_27400 [Streptomyces nanshensis]|nr:hypothetical protein AN220_27400 [Streptomyces nanshensis]
MSGEQHGVGQEAGQLHEVGGAAVREVGVRFGRHSDGDRGGRHELGVGGLFAGQDDERDAGAAQQVDALLPGPHAAEQPDDDEVDSVQQRFEFGTEGVLGYAARVGVAVGERGGGTFGAVARGRRGDLGGGGTGAEEVRVGGRQEQDHPGGAVGGGDGRVGVGVVA